MAPLDKKVPDPFFRIFWVECGTFLERTNCSNYAQTDAAMFAEVAWVKHHA